MSPRPCSTTEEDWAPAHKEESALLKKKGEGARRGVPLPASVTEVRTLMQRLDAVKIPHSSLILLLRLPGHFPVVLRRVLLPAGPPSPESSVACDCGAGGETRRPTLAIRGRLEAAHTRRTSSDATPVCWAPKTTHASCHSQSCSSYIWNARSGQICAPTEPSDCQLPTAA